MIGTGLNRKIRELEIENRRLRSEVRKQQLALERKNKLLNELMN